MENGYSDLPLLAEELIERLVETKRFVEAASVMIDYCQDVAGGVSMMCKGLAFAESIRVVRRPWS